MKTESMDDAKAFERVLCLLLETREKLSRELSERKSDLERGSTRGLSWTDLERELSDASWS